MTFARGLINKDIKIDIPTLFMSDAVLESDGGMQTFEVE